MKLRFKAQKFQQEAAQAVVDIFKGQSYQSAQYREILLTISNGSLPIPYSFFRNSEIVLNDTELLNNIRAVQKRQDLPVSERVLRTEDGTLALSVEMETGTGKTYTYLKTMYELHKHYGWSKFIIVVPSVAIREGVVKSFEIMADHFAEEYNGERVQPFVYDSARLTEIRNFSSDAKIRVMIINTQAFNARGEDARRIYMELEKFNWERPISSIAQTRPIMIIDEPQSVLGADKNNKTRANLQDFDPLFFLLYSATHRQENVYNQVYRLDAIDAFSKKLVKKLEVIGIEQIGTTATNGYLYLDAIVLAKRKGDSPRARISFDALTNMGLRQVTRLVSAGFDLYLESGEIESYAGYTIERIDARKGCICLSSGQEIYEGQAIGYVTEEAIRRIQIRTTIKKHLEREAQLYRRGIKVLSLFFIDSVEKYRIYSAGSEVQKGRWAEIFEEEYNLAKEAYLADETLDASYRNYLAQIATSATHAGYFAQDKQGKMKDPKIEKRARSKADSEAISNDQSAYQLIMRDKERLLSLTEHTRFIFSHSTLKEGWDNPNVFQICTLKQSNSTIKKRQEVGRGMRLCVNQKGERQDSDLLADEVYDINILTVIASESYKTFAETLQKEIAETITSRPLFIDANFFVGKKLISQSGQKHEITEWEAQEIRDDLLLAGYLKSRKLTPKYYEDKHAGKLQLELSDSSLQDFQFSIFKLLDQVFDQELLKIENGRGRQRAKFRKNLFDDSKFQELWKRINSKTYFEVEFDSTNLIDRAIKAVNENLAVTEIYFALHSGELSQIDSKEDLLRAKAMSLGEAYNIKGDIVLSGVKYDLIGELVRITGLKRATIGAILSGLEDKTFVQFSKNPEEFIVRCGDLINKEKATTVIEQISYHKINKSYDVSVFSEQDLRGRIGENAIESQKSLYDLVVVDSQTVEKNFAEDLEKQQEVEVYTKLPRGFYINTPMGKYNPDWAIVFNNDDKKKHIYFVAETKGANSDVYLRSIEQNKIKCAKKHFASISDSRIRFEVVKDFKTLYDKVVQD